jgi:hypothetical protein
MDRTREVDIDALFEEGTPIDEAMSEAARSAIELHRRMGVPMVVWRDGKVAYVTPEELDAQAERESPPLGRTAASLDQDVNRRGDIASSRGDACDA